MSIADIMKSSTNKKAMDKKDSKEGKKKMPWDKDDKKDKK
jgi:hypothetical protein